MIVLFQIEGSSQAPPPRRTRARCSRQRCSRARISDPQSGGRQKQHRRVLCRGPRTPQAAPIMPSNSGAAGPGPCAAPYEMHEQCKRTLLQRTVRRAAERRTPRHQHAARILPPPRSNRIARDGIPHPALPLCLCALGTRGISTPWHDRSLGCVHAADSQPARAIGAQ